MAKREKTWWAIKCPDGDFALTSDGLPILREIGNRKSAELSSGPMDKVVRVKLVEVE